METLMTVKEVAKLTSLAPSSIYGLASTSKIPHIRIGTRVVFSPSALSSWIKSQSITPTQASP